MAETLQNLLQGFSTALSATNLFYAFMGCLIGTMVGVLPGVGPLAGISLLLPTTFGLEPTAGLNPSVQRLLRGHVRRIDDIHPDGGFPGRPHR